MEDRIKAGDVVQHFKRETLTEGEKKTGRYLYRIIGEAEHTESGEKLMVYRALYGDGRLYVRPYEQFMSRVDTDKYPDIRQEYRFETVAAEGEGDGGI